MIKEKDIAWAKKQLQTKYNELGRLPKKEDYDEVTRSRIKAFLGAWPRALEVAGLKEIRNKKSIRQLKKTQGQAEAVKQSQNLQRNETCGNETQKLQQGVEL